MTVGDTNPEAFVIVYVLLMAFILAVTAGIIAL